MAESALRALVPRPQEIVAPTRSWNPLNPAFRDTVSSAVSNLLGSSNIAGREGYDRSRYADMLTGSVDFVPGVSEAAGVGDVRREVSQGNYPGAALAGVATALGVAPVIGDAAAKAVRGASQSATRSVRQVAEDAMKSIPGLKLGVYGNPENGYTISRIEIPKDLRNTGLGTSVMRSITQAADQEGARLMLTPTSDFGGDKNRLTEFYRRLGFINNSGRAKDFTTMETMIRPPSDAAAKAIRGLDMSQAARMQRAQEQGYTGPFYHGSGRIDRVVESGKIDPRRATSGPMPYFTDSPELASKYAMSKQDTSLPEGQMPEFFRVSPKDIGISGRSTIPVERSWHFLSPEVKADIRERALRVGFENIDESSGKLMLHPSGVEASPSRTQYEYLMKTTAKGNPLAALRELWAESGILYGDEEKLADVYRLAGFPARIDQSSAPWTEAKGVLPAMLRISNPLVTENTDELTNRVIPALREEFKNDRTRLKQFGADSWDKNTQYTPKQWVDELAQDISEGKNSYVWTSIPDKVTNALERLGYDGILDISGKGGGTRETVAIPFRPDQVRSINAAFDPANRGSANIMAGVGGALVGGSALRALLPQEQERQPD